MPQPHTTANDRPLSIAFLVSRFPTTSETFISRKFAFLLEQGHDVHVFCAVRGEDVDYPRTWKSRIHVTPGHSAGYRHVPVAALRYCKALLNRRIDGKWFWRLRIEAGQYGMGFVPSFVNISHLVGKRWDLVHSHFLTSLQEYIGMRHVVRCPVVASAYGYDLSIMPHQTKGLAILAAQVQQVEGLTFSSKYLRGLLHQSGETCVEEMVLAPEVPTALFRARRRDAPHAPLRLLSVGRLSWMKGFLFALSAVRCLLDQGVHCEYRIVGEGQQREELEYTIRDLMLQQHVHLEGALPPEGVSAAMEWADILLLSSVKEEFGVVLIEAQASGLPIVATNVGGVPEAVRESATALLVPPREPRAMTAAIARLLDDKQLYRSLSEHGPRYAAQFDTQCIGTQLVAFYRRILAHADA